MMKGYVETETVSHSKGARSKTKKGKYTKLD